MDKLAITCVVFLCTIENFTLSSNYLGPDPWDYIKVETSSKKAENTDIPPDLKIPLKKKIQSDGNLVNGEWFFKRALAIVLNGGIVRTNDDGSVDISLQMKLDPKRWQVLTEYTKSHTALSEDMFRRSIAYVEEAIYKPTITEKISMAWTDYIQTFFVSNKTYIVWCSGIMAAIGITSWLYQHISHKHVIILIFLALYLYEVVISYKEAEQQELDRFLSAVNKCSWYFWKTTCEISPPDPIIFMKHMNPMKIGLRMFTTILSEPVKALSGTVNVMIHDITDTMWFPFDIILRSFLIISINIMLIVLLIMIIFNYILNIPFDLNFLLGSIKVKQRKRTVNFDVSNNNSQPVETTGTISGATLDRILDVFSRALDNSNNTPKMALNAIADQVPKLKRSSSTGRLPNTSLENFTLSNPKIYVKKRNVAPFMIGGGDTKDVRTNGWKNRFIRKRQSPDPNVSQAKDKSTP